MSFFAHCYILPSMHGGPLDSFFKPLTTFQEHMHGKVSIVFTKRLGSFLYYTWFTLYTNMQWYNC